MKLKKISNRLGIDPSELEAMEQVTLSNDTHPESSMLL